MFGLVNEIVFCRRRFQIFKKMSRRVWWVGGILIHEFGLDDHLTGSGLASCQLLIVLTTGFDKERRNRST